MLFVLGLVSTEGVVNLSRVVHIEQDLLRHKGVLLVVGVLSHELADPLGACEVDSLRSLSQETEVFHDLVGIFLAIFAGFHEAADQSIKPRERVALLLIPLEYLKKAELAIDEIYNSFFGVALEEVCLTEVVGPVCLSLMDLEPELLLSSCIHQLSATEVFINKADRRDEVHIVEVAHIHQHT